MTSPPPPRQRLPFEPKQTKKKQSKTSPISTKIASPPPRSQASLQAIPDAVSKRMIKRMALFSGIPTGLGMMSFVLFYWIVSHDWLEIPTYVVFAVSLGLFGLGVLGLSYGIFSTSWDDDSPGHWWGWQEFKLNLGRTTKAWRSERKAIKEDS
jgi:hypothetical protein